MSKYIDADKLIAEIERYENTAIDAYNPLGEDADFWHGKVVACEDLKTLVTSLQQEMELPEKYQTPDWLFEGQEQPVDGLEETATEFANQDCVTFISRKKGFIAGAEWMKAKMMEDAVEGMVMDFSSNLPRPQVDIRLDPGKYHTGDKVRVIVIKED